MELKDYLFYKDDWAEIYCADCRDILPMLEPVDLVLTDPPYGIDGSSGTINMARGKGNYSLRFTDNQEYIETVVVPIIVCLIKIVIAVVVTPGNKNLSKYPQPDSFGTFYQPASVGLQSFGNADSQPIFYYGKNPIGRNMGIPCSYILTEQPENNGHPCPKPIKAWQRLLSNISLSGQSILDPFMGSGTTLVAAKNLNRKSIGIEIEPKYCEIAVKRLRQEVFDFRKRE